ncbi:cytochrome P450 [Chytriomyces sp. MP71]|nr:cytochrome P450 [Chytriomyces sp. MP71]
MFSDSNLNTRPTIPDALKEMHLFETGVTFNNNVQKWKHNRKLLIEGVGRPRFIRSIAPKINGQMEDILPLLDTIATAGIPVLANRMFSLISMDVIMDVVFSVRNQEVVEYLKCVMDGTDSQQPFLDTMHAMTEGMSLLLSSSSWMRRWIPKVRSEVKKFNRSLLEFEQFLDNKIQEKRESLSSHPSSDHIDFSTSLLLDAETSKPENLRELHANLRASIVGGTETSSNAMAFLTYELARQPVIQDAIAQEVQQVVGEGRIESEHVGKLVLVEACIHETLRLHSVASLVSRRIETENYTFGAYKLARGAALMVPTHTNHTSDSLWKDPFKFDPVRFLDGEKGAGPQGKEFAYTPFGGGVRKW